MNGKRQGSAQGERGELGLDEAAVMAAFSQYLTFRLEEQTIVSRAFAMPAKAHEALDDLVGRGVLVREAGEPVLYRRAGDSLSGVLLRHLLWTILVAGVTAVVAWILSRVGLEEVSALEGASVMLLLGLLALLPLGWREAYYARRRHST